MRASLTIPRTPLVSAASLLLAFGLVGAEPPEARAETVQSCRRKGCRLSVNTYRCVCPRRRSVKRGKVRLRCPRGTRQTHRKFKHSAYRRNWGTVYRCMKRRGGKDILHGPMVTLWPNGVRRFEARFVNGKKHGVYKTYDRQGKLWRLEHFVAGKAHGRFQGWYSGLGKRQTEGQWRGGRRVGLWKSWHRNGQLKEQGQYVKGRRSGLWVQHHANGKKRMETPYKNGREEGVRKMWNAAEKLVQTTTYVKGSRHGSEWSIQSGYKTVTAYRRGLKHGAKRVWHKSGQLSQETHYYGDIATGLERRWNRRRVLVLRCRNLGGRVHGLYERWYDNGKLRERGKYLKGRKVGQWVQYAPDGSVLNRHTY